MTREAFEAALRADRCDTAARLVFADWLEERGLDDEAAEQRRRASPEWVAAARRLADLRPLHADDYDAAYRERREPTWRELTFDEIIAAGERYQDDGALFCQLGEEGLRNLAYDEEWLAQFWADWRTVTGRNVARPGPPFDCSC